MPKKRVTYRLRVREIHRHKIEDIYWLHLMGVCATQIAASTKMTEKQIYDLLKRHPELTHLQALFRSSP